jgi:pilus assembly protein Flp/PilA
MAKHARFVKDETGATAIEYALMAAAIVMVLVAVMPVIVGRLTPIFTSISGGLT